MPAAPASSVLTLASCVLAFVFLLERVRLSGLARDRVPPWWAGYMRDSLHVGAALVLAAGCVLAGLPAPQSLALGCILALAIYGLHTLFAFGLVWRRVSMPTLVIGLALLVPICLAPTSVSGFLRRVFEALF